MKNKTDKKELVLNKPAFMPIGQVVDISENKDSIRIHFMGYENEGKCYVESSISLTPNMANKLIVSLKKVMENGTKNRD